MELVAGNEVKAAIDENRLTFVGQCLTRHCLDAPALFYILEGDRGSAGRANHRTGRSIVIVFMLNVRVSAWEIAAFSPFFLKLHGIAHLHRR
jgi:hypothetical protein